MSVRWRGGAGGLPWGAWEQKIVCVRKPGISFFGGGADEEKERGREREGERAYLEQYSITGAQGFSSADWGKEGGVGRRRGLFVR